jgi:hypothetical protein
MTPMAPTNIFASDIGNAPRAMQVRVHCLHL